MKKRLAIIFTMVSMLFVGSANKSGGPTGPSLSGPSSPCSVSGPVSVKYGESGRFTVSCGQCSREDDGGAFDCASEEPYAPDYRFDWGDNSVSPWGGGSQDHLWNQAGIYYVKAQARCDDGVSS